MADRRTQLATRLGPGALAGIRLWDWIRLLAENRFCISPRFIPRAIGISAISPGNSLFATVESLLLKRRWMSVDQPSPLFLLGGWRSGTTHLHNLFGVDDRFTCPTLYQTMYPWSFLLTSSWWQPVVESMTPKKRFQDNVAMSMEEPAQDEMAMCIMSLRSSMLSWVFPRSAERYDRYLTFQQATDREKASWVESLKTFVQKVQYKASKPLVLKSPYHTARVQILLDAFPSAKFLHIHRHPFEVYPSYLHTLRKVNEAWGLQTHDESRLEDWAIETYRDLYQAFFDQKALVPANRFHEISYDELSKDAIGTLSQAYEALELPEFSGAQDAIQAYVDSLSDYQKNRYDDLPESLKARLREEWVELFDAWGYSSE